MSCINNNKITSKINIIVRYYTIWIMTLFIFFVVNNNNQNCFVFVSSTNINNKSNFNVPESNTLKIAIMSPRIKKSNGKPVGWSTTSLVATLLAIDIIFILYVGVTITKRYGTLGCTVLNCCNKNNHDVDEAKDSQDSKSEDITDRGGFSIFLNPMHDKANNSINNDDDGTYSYKNKNNTNVGDVELVEKKTITEIWRKKKKSH